MQKKGKTMSDYIKREDATEVYSKLYWMHDGLLNFQEELGKVYDEILSIPSADVAPVRHERWVVIDAEEPRRYGCSECKRLSWNMDNYCPNCGARMDGGIDSEKPDENV